MSTAAVHARIRQCYVRRDESEASQAAGCDPDSDAIETRTPDSDLDEIDLAAWIGMPLGFGEPPEEWTGPMDGED